MYQKYRYAKTGVHRLWFFAGMLKVDLEISMRTLDSRHTTYSSDNMHQKCEGMIFNGLISKELKKKDC